MFMRSFAVCWALFASCIGPAGAQDKRTVAEIYTQANAMIFFVVRGDADSCGPGCSEWIAAEGSFDQDVAKRFRSFLDTLKARKLPIYFNSTGGFMGQSRLVGRILRERRMTASVGATIPDGCNSNNTMDSSCRQIVKSSRTLKAKLRVAGAMCHSACIYALVGASVRHVPADALLGVHGTTASSGSVAISRRPGAPTAAQLHAARRQYMSQMGVDPEVVELATKVPSAGLRILTRDEITRFRIETPFAATAR
jgi:hypothetical protein